MGAGWRLIISAGSPFLPGNMIGNGTSWTLLNWWSLMSLRLYIHLISAKSVRTVASCWPCR